MTDSPTTRPPNRSRRRFLGRAAVAVAGGTAAAAGVAARPARAAVTQALAHYQATPKGKASCTTCSQFVSPNACKVVSGGVSPLGWCLLFAPKL